MCMIGGENKDYNRYVVHYGLRYKSTSWHVKRTQTNGSFTLAKSDSETNTDSMKSYCQWVVTVYFSVSASDSISVSVNTL